MRYKISFVSDIVLFILLFFGLIYMSDDMVIILYYGAEQQQGRLLILIGYVYWQISSTALGVSANVISEEAKNGTLEAKLLGKTPCVYLLFSRLMAGILIGVVSLAAVVCTAVLIGWLPINQLIFLVQALFIYIPSLLGMFGMGLIFGGITLKEKSIGQFLFMIQTALLFLSNIISVNDNLVSKAIPYIYGIGLARNLFLGREVEALQILFYVLLNFVWLTIGILFFNFILDKNRKYGFFSAY